MVMDIIKKAKLPLLLLTVLLVPLFVGPYTPVYIKSMFLGFSMAFKSLLLLFLPFIIFSFLFHSLSSLKQGAITFVLLLIICVFCSNMIAINVGYLSGTTFLSFMHIDHTPNGNIQTLEPAFILEIPQIIKNEFALIAGFILGIYLSLRPSEVASSIAKKMNIICNKLLRTCFIPILPLFILGFAFKLEHEDSLEYALTSYGPVFLIVISTQILYLLLFYFIAGKFSFERTLTYIKNVLPATLTGLSTVSSAASLPVLVMSTEKNLNDTKLAQSIVPATINIHTIGSAIGLTVLTLATLMTFNQPLPSLSQFLVFAFFYAVAKFGVAAVPGGVVIVAVPLLEKYLGFTGEMSGVITAIYMIFDPFGTSVNVTGNGAFAIIFSRTYKIFNKKEDISL